MKCPDCGAANADSATFCSLCLKAFDGTGATTASLGGGPGVATPPGVPPADPVTASIDSEAAATAYLDSMRVGVSSPPEAVFAAKRGVDAALVGRILRYGMWPILFLAGVAIWIASGGWSSMEAGKLAEVPVPPGAILLGTVAETTEGPMGPLDPERVEQLAIRVFAVPMAVEAANDYYGSGAGAKVLAENGWAGGELRDEPLAGEYRRWDREAALGLRAKEDQELYMTFGGAGHAADVVGAQVPAGYSIVRVWCEAMGVERFEFPER